MRMRNRFSASPSAPTAKMLQTVFLLLVLVALVNGQSKYILCSRGTVQCKMSRSTVVYDSV